MNLILFEAHETTEPIPRQDPRAIHILKILQRAEGDLLDVGLVNGPRGKAVVQTITDSTLALRFTWGTLPPPLDPITLIVGLPRPQTARKILQEATSIGASALHFVRTEKGDPSYGQSTLWSSGEWRRHLKAGAEQAFSTHLPEVTWGNDLETSLATPPKPAYAYALDNYEGAQRLGAAHFDQRPGSAETFSVALAIGPERGWSNAERENLRHHGFTLVHLGERVLRTETAAIAALTLIRAQLGLM